MLDQKNPRIIQYATFQELQDYFKWRQVDAHINNLYNTTFWALVKQGKRSTQEAHSDLKGTFSKDKHSILFDRFQINYNNEPEVFKKGSILIWDSSAKPSTDLSCVADPSIGQSLCEADGHHEEKSLNEPLPGSKASIEPSDPDPAPQDQALRSDAMGGDQQTNSVYVVHQDLVKDQWWTTGPGSKFPQ